MQKSVPSCSGCAESLGFTAPQPAEERVCRERAFQTEDMGAPPPPPTQGSCAGLRSQNHLGLFRHNLTPAGQVLTDGRVFRVSGDDAETGHPWPVWHFIADLSSPSLPSSSSPPC